MDRWPFFCLSPARSKRVTGPIIDNLCIFGIDDAQDHQALGSVIHGYAISRGHFDLNVSPGRISGVVAGIGAAQESQTKSFGGDDLPY